jgi:hypothetical protein
VSARAPEIENALNRRRAERPELLLLDVEALHERLISEFLSRDQFFVERVRKNRMQNIDLRKYVKAARFERTAEGYFLAAVLEISNQGGAKPVEVVNAIYGIDEAEQAALQSRVRRSRLYAEMDGRDCSLLYHREHRVH